MEDIPTICNVAEDEYRRRPSPRDKTQHVNSDEISKLAEQENDINFSYSASKHEKAWLINSLSDFYRQQWFDDVLALRASPTLQHMIIDLLRGDLSHTQLLEIIKRQFPSLTWKIIKGQ